MNVLCPLCGADAAPAWMEIREHHTREPFRIVQCSGCGIRYLNPAPALEAMERYYSTNSSGEQMRRSPGALFRTLQRLAFARETRPLRRHLQAGDTILDVGAGDGAMVRFLQEGNYRTGAIDFYPQTEWLIPEVPYRSVNLHGGCLSKETIASVLGEPPRAAVIRHVLEHLQEPQQVLRAIFDAGTEFVYIVVPNCASPFARWFGESWYYWDPPRHLQFFEQRTLGALCKSSGFEVVKQGHYGIDEIVTSAHRALYLRGAPGPFREALRNATKPKGTAAALSSALMSLGAKTVCWCLAQRKA